MIRLDRLTIGYRGRQLVCGACADIAPGRLTALLGRNGTGKSSLLRVIAGVDRPLDGTVWLDGQDVHSLPAAEKAKCIATVSTMRVRVPDLRCADVVGMGRAPYTDWLGRMTDNDREIVNRSLRLAGMEEYASRALDTLSDGECQRVMIARALAQQTPVILLDEPTSFLDIPNRHDIVRLLGRLAHEEGKTILFSTHELDLAMSLCEDILLIDPPEIISGTADSVSGSGILDRLFRISAR